MMISNLNYIVPMLNSLPIILDWLDSVDEHLDSLHFVIMLNFMNIILLISMILKAYLSINIRSVDEMDAHELIEFLMGYRLHKLITGEYFEN